MPPSHPSAKPETVDRTTAVLTSIGVGELSAPVGLRQLFSGITDTAQAQVRSHNCRLEAAASHALGESASDARLQSERRVPPDECR